MRKVLTVLVLFIFSFACLAAGDEWTRADTERQVVYLALHIIDWGQTRNIAKNPVLYREVNPILGKHPSMNKVNGYFIVGVLVHTGIAYVLPAEWRKRFQCVTIGIETGYAVHNYATGIKMNF